MASGRTGVAGGPGGAGTGAALPTVPTGSAPTLTVTAQTRTTESATVTGQGQGFWLVLGQSLSRGWHARLRPAGGGEPVDLGSPTLIDGYANGWYVPASVARGTLAVTLTWAPQKVVWVALAASGLALVVCLVMALWPRRRRSPAAGAAVDGTGAEEGVDHAGSEGGTDRPVGSALLGYEGEQPAWRSSVGWALGAGVVAGLVSSPLAIPVGFVLVLAGLRLRRSRVLLGWAAPALVLTCGAYMLAEQAGHRYLSNIDWPGQFPAANTLGWSAVLLLGADVLVDLVRSRSVNRAE